MKITLTGDTKKNTNNFLEAKPGLPKSKESSSALKMAIVSNELPEAKLTPEQSKQKTYILLYSNKRKT